MINAQQILSQLRDIHAPNPISNWPATQAWYLLFLLIFIVMSFLLSKLIRLTIRKKRQQKIIRLVKEAVTIYPKNPTTAIANLSILLRRLMLAKHDRKQVAHLHDQAWLEFLDQQLQTTEFSVGVGRTLLSAPYQKSAEVDIISLANLIERLIKRVI